MADNLRPARAQNNRSGGILIYLLILVSLQIFMMVVAVEGVLSHNAGLATAAAVFSVLTTLMAFGFRWFVTD